MQSPNYYRARLQLMEDSIKSGDKPEQELKLLRNGYFPEKENKKAILKNSKSHSNRALDFSELSRFNTWFEMHPEKIAGTEIITSSRSFPLKIKGSKTDISKMFNAALNTSKGDEEALAIAIALELQLALMKL